MNSTINSTEDPNLLNLSIFEWLDKQGIFFILPLFFLITSILIFPIYHYVFHQNREKDQATAVFPIVNHFYHVVKTALMAIALGIFLCTVFQILLNISTCCLFAYLLTLILGSLAFQQVQYLLHFLLALQRFLLYFYPGTEKYVVLTEKSMKRVVKWLYGTCICSTAGIIICSKFVSEKLNAMFFRGYMTGSFFTIHSTLIMFLNLLLFISIILYLSIMISVRKFTNLVSAVQNKPQRYIFYQAILLFITRIPSVTYLFILLYGHSTLNIIDEFVWIVLSDLFQTPLTIQVSYLFCNRRNVKAMFSTINVFNWCRSGRHSAQVQPGHQHQTYLESTHV